MSARLAVAGLALALGPAPPGAVPPADVGEAGEAAFIALQPERRVEQVALPGGAGAMQLTQLAPQVNAWMLLSLPAPEGGVPRRFHLENPEPPQQRVALDAARPGTLVLTRNGVPTPCTMWPDAALRQAANSGLAFAPLCGGRLLLRNARPGSRSTLAATTEFLRDHVWGGEHVIGFVKREFFRDAFIERAASAPAPGGSAATAPSPGSAATAASPPGAASAPAAAPLAAQLRPGAAAAALSAEGLGLELMAPGRALQPGRWHAAAALPGIWVSAVQPGALAAGLDAVEAQALAYLVAFDLGTHELGFALGTEHPRLGWSARVPPERRPGTLPGPDGFASAAPLARTGMLSPAGLGRVVAAFTGGFKREHGAFRHGPLAAVNSGSHYGFIEQGVVFSRLQPGLATLFVQRDGTAGMGTWSPALAERLGPLRHARQNGVPLVEPGPDGAAAIGSHVQRWAAGNWSGSPGEQLRTLRAGACMAAHEGRRFLLYGYFSTATPLAMAQTFRAYGCPYAMHLDMNALEHTYLALYPRSGAVRGVEHLVPGMAVLDRRDRGQLLPRFLGFPDDRDFFYLAQRVPAR